MKSRSQPLYKRMSSTQETFPNPVLTSLENQCVKQRFWPKAMLNSDFPNTRLESQRNSGSLLLRYSWFLSVLINIKEPKEIQTQKSQRNTKTIWKLHYAQTSLNP